MEGSQQRKKIYSTYLSKQCTVIKNMNLSKVNDIINLKDSLEKAAVGQNFLSIDTVKTFLNTGRTVKRGATLAKKRLLNLKFQKSFWNKNQNYQWNAELLLQVNVLKVCNISR